MVSYDAAISSAIELDIPHLSFAITFPDNSTGTLTSYDVDITYVENNKSKTERVSISQCGLTDTNVQAVRWYLRPFINRMYLYFKLDNNTTSNLTQPFITTIGEGADYTAPHFSSVLDFRNAYDRGDLTVGQWVYVDGQGYNSSTNNQNYSYNSTSKKITTLTFSATGTTSPTSSNPAIIFSSVYDYEFAQFSSRPNASTLNAIGFQVPASGVGTSTITISSDAFVFIKSTSN